MGFDVKLPVETYLNENSLIMKQLVEVVKVSTNADGSIRIQLDIIGDNIDSKVMSVARDLMKQECTMILGVSSVIENNT